MIEKKLQEKSLIDLTELNIVATQRDLDFFLEKESSQTLIRKATFEG